ncbi:MAG TPA: DUF72 domain-containing protein [Chryseosolibacter sp.]|nr:DUF72 domain-containing protein [Chryseosolibacter sp.]
MEQPLFPERYLSGLSGIVLPLPKYQFPPEFQNCSRLTYYTTKFNSIEINSSFYKIPMRSTIARWVGSVHDKFTFTFKLIRDVTHMDHLRFRTDHVQQFFEAISPASNRGGCVLIQFPPTLDFRHASQLAELLETIRALESSRGWNIAVEFRNKSWYQDATVDLLASQNAALVLHDIPKSAAPMIITATDFVYLRFHGPTGNYGGSYPDSFLSEYAAYARAWLAEGKYVFIYFNNTKGDAYNNLTILNAFVMENQSW